VEEVICGDDVYVPTKVICVGRNFADHAEEMADSALPTEPLVFLKPNSSIASEPDRVYIPEDLGLLHHEVELCALVGRSGKGFDAEGAKAAIAALAVGIDFTLRDMQSVAKGGGHPWTISKGFDSACVVGRFLPCGEAGAIEGRSIRLAVNGEDRQGGDLAEMVFTPEEILLYVSRYMTVERGDVIMCGTPAGVGPVNDGDRIHAAVEGLPELDFQVNRNQR